MAFAATEATNWANMVVAGWCHHEETVVVVRGLTGLYLQQKRNIFTDV